MLATKIFLVRHGETQWNLEGRMQGHLDSPLTDKGVAQAQALAEKLRHYAFAALYSSDLSRAMRTAQYLSKQQVFLKSCLRERNLGIFQGALKKDLDVLFPEEFRHYSTHHPDYVVPDGESGLQFRKRCVKCLEEIAQQHLGEQILVVAHGGVLNSIFKHTFDLPYAFPRHFSLSNAALNVFSYHSHHWTLETWGEVSHLENLKF